MSAYPHTQARFSASTRLPVCLGGCFIQIRDADGKWIPYVPAANRTERDSCLPAEERAKPPPGSLRELGERDRRLQWNSLGFKAFQYTNDFRRRNRLPQLAWSQVSEQGEGCFLVVF